VQPLRGTLSSVLIRRDLSFQLRNAIFGSAKLMRELLSRAQHETALALKENAAKIQERIDTLEKEATVANAVLAAAAARAERARGCNADE
jgi:hypothetical protein